MKKIKNTALLVLLIFVISVGKSQNPFWKKRNYYGYNDTIVPNFINANSTPFEFNGKIYTGLELNINDYSKRILFRYDILNDKWETIKQPFSLFRDALSWFTFQNKLYVIARDSSSISGSDPTFIFDYNPETGTAIKKSQTPLSFSWFYKIQNCKVGNSIYFLRDSFWVYEPLIDKWTQTTTSTLPYAKYNTTVYPNLGPNMCSLNNEIYIFSDSIYKYLPATNNWINKGKIDYRLSSTVGISSQCLSFNNKIYFPKGILDKIHSQPGNKYSSIIEYNPVNDSIKEKARNWGEDGIQSKYTSLYPELPVISGSVFYGGKLYCFSDCSGGFYAYDFQSDSFYLKANYSSFLKFGSHPFAIGSKIYYGSEYGLGASRNYWSFDTINYKWTRIADLPTTNYSFGAFSIADKGYSLHHNGNDTFSLFQYSPASNLWSSKKPFTYNLLGGWGLFLTIGYDMYMGTSLYGPQLNNGSPIRSSKFWKYESITDSWVQKANVPGNPRDGAIGFSLNGKIYIGGGSSFDSQSNPIYHQDFWEYNPSNNSWSAKANIPIPTVYPSSLARSCSINNEGFLIMNWIILKYNPIVNKWDTMYYYDINNPSQQLFNENIIGAVSVGSKIFSVTSGFNTSQIPAFYEFGVFSDNNTTNLFENDFYNSIKIYPNPTTGWLKIETENHTTITIQDLNGKILQTQDVDKQGQIDISSLSSGMYLLRTKEGVTRKFIKE